MVLYINIENLFCLQKCGDRDFYQLAIYYLYQLFNNSQDLVIIFIFQLADITNFITKSIYKSFY